VLFLLFLWATGRDRKKQTERVFFLSFSLLATIEREIREREFSEDFPLPFSVTNQSRVRVFESFFSFLHQFEREREVSLLSSLLAGKTTKKRTEFQFC
jgi:hypothetical protein